MHLSCPLPFWASLPPHPQGWILSRWGPGGRIHPWSPQDTSQRGRRNPINQTGHVRIFHSVLFRGSFYPFCSESLGPALLLLPLLSFLRLPPTISLSLACASSGHGSLSQLQRGCVWTGELSYFPSPLHDTQTPMLAYMHLLYPRPHCKHVCVFFLFFIFCPACSFIHSAHGRTCEFILLYSELAGL